MPIRKSVARKLGDALDRASPSFRRPSPHWNSSKLGGGKARFTRYRRDISSIPPDFRIVIGRVNGFAVHGVDDVIRLTRSKVFRDVKRGPYTRDDSISKKTKRKSKAAKFSNEIKRGPRSREWRSGNEADKCNSRSRANDSSRNEKYRTSPSLPFSANEIPFTRGDKDGQRYGLILGGSHRASVDAVAVKGLNRFREWRRNVVSRSSICVYIYIYITYERRVPS